MQTILSATGTPPPVPDIPLYHLQAHLACGPVELNTLARRVGEDWPDPISTLMLKVGILKHVRPGALRLGQGWDVELDPAEAADQAHWD